MQDTAIRTFNDLFDKLQETASALETGSLDPVTARTILKARQLQIKVVEVNLAARRLAVRQGSPNPKVIDMLSGAPVEPQPQLN